MPRYSVIINWCDEDAEQGTFGWSGVAIDEGDAELKAREEMATTELDEGEELDDSIDVMDTGGSVVEITRGAVWSAQELEDALRAILPYAESRAENMDETADDALASGRDDADEARAAANKAICAVDAAKALLASLDAA